MIPNRKVVGSNPAKDTTRIIFTISRGIFQNTPYPLKKMNLKIKLKK